MRSAALDPLRGPSLHADPDRHHPPASRPLPSGVGTKWPPGQRHPRGLRGSPSTPTVARLPASPFLFFSLVTTVMDMVGVAAASPLLGSLLTWRDRKVHLSVFLVVGESFFSASLFLSAG